MKGGEGANAERHIAEEILGQIEGADGWSIDVKRQVIELVAGEIENCEARRPLCHIWDFCESVVGEIELSQARKLEKTFWDRGQLIVLEIDLDNLQNIKRKMRIVISLISVSVVALN